VRSSLSLHPFLRQRVASKRVVSSRLARRLVLDEDDVIARTPDPAIATPTVTASAR
jgi:hypothetical protein|tara:strand:+ start:9284 stop:9451 length:168 start_codon:yes stop_codon:yes gene_type:complete